MFELAVQVKVSNHKGEEFLQTLRSLQNDEAGETGATNLRLFKDGEGRSTYRLIHTWETEEELAKYLSGEKFRILLGALRVLCEGSVVKYRHIPENLIHYLQPVLDQPTCGFASW
jgi:quinol monooxygenase YgiN